MKDCLLLLWSFPPYPVVSFLHDRCVNVLGRSSGCEIVVRDPTISRRHATIEVGALGATVIDLGSRNGTFVYGQRVQRANLIDGQQVRFGAVTLLISSTCEKQTEDDLVSSEVATDSGGESNDVKIKARLKTAVGLLSPAQHRVCDLLMQGLSEKRIASRLLLSLKWTPLSRPKKSLP